MGTILRTILRTTLIVTLMSSFPAASWAWNPTGHEVVARIAWDSLTPATRQRVVALLRAAPSDACMGDLFPSDRRPLAIRNREFFVRASTWPDIVRPTENDERTCIRYHRSEWHYINYFWQGVSGETGADRPRDRADLAPPLTNVVAQLPLLRAVAVCESPRCGTAQPDRALALAWILHLVGDIHQPLHTSARVTPRPDERNGDQGGNLFILQSEPRVLRLHGYWDGILDRSVPRRDAENEMEYVGRLAAAIKRLHPPGELAGRIQPGAYDAWAREGLATVKTSAYPATLKREILPNEEYRERAFRISQESIALAAYRLADLLNVMFGD
jgi:hypothetical protein